ncbi:MAG: HpcH/HpaI aldolase/citrate lyase family protein [Rhodospirillaceae bacterium]|jgi:citrate lyase subunit beta/citryl-CoA lyase
MATSLRSYILVPASDASASRAALAGSTDLVVLDLEDTVPEDLKPRARIMLRTGMSADWAGDERCAVRVNTWHSKAGEVDRTALAGLYLPAVVLPKVNTPDIIDQAREVLTDDDLGDSSLHAIIETPEGLSSVGAISNTAVTSLVVGAFDLAKALGIDPEPNATAILDARVTVASAATSAGVSSFDMPWVAVQDEAGFETHLAQAYELGFTGCCAMNEAQAQRINEVFSTTG